MGKIMSEQVSANVDVKPEQPAPEKGQKVLVA